MIGDGSGLDGRSPELTDHFRKPQNVGAMPARAITIEVSDPSAAIFCDFPHCWGTGGFTTPGSRWGGWAASIGVGSVLTQLITRRDKASLETLCAADVEQAVGALSIASRHTAVLCVDTVRALSARFPV